MQKKPCILVVTGHYGSGKSLFAVNAAVGLKRLLRETGNELPVTLCDLDIVNPYFRSADSEALLEQAGVELIAQQFANSNVDIPSIPGKLNRVFDRQGFSVLDIGGDDSGASVLGGLSAKLKEYGFSHYNVVNFKRPQSATAEDAYETIRSIETTARLPVTGLVHNTNLGEETYPELLCEYAGEAERLSKMLGLAEPIIHTYAGEFSLPFDGELYQLLNYTKRYY